MAPSRCLHVRRCQIDGDGAEEGSARPPIDPRLFDEFVAWSAVVCDVAPPLPAAAASWLYHGRRTLLGCKLHSPCGRRYVRRYTSTLYTCHLVILSSASLASSFPYLSYPIPLHTHSPRVTRLHHPHVCRPAVRLRHTNRQHAPLLHACNLHACMSAFLHTKFLFGYLRLCARTKVHVVCMYG